MLFSQRPPAREISIGQVASRSGLAVSAIRYYEVEGLIHAERNKGGHRRYRRDVIRRLAFIQIAKQFGFPLSWIRARLSELPSGRTPTSEDWAGIGAAIRSDLDKRIETLTMMRDRLDGCIGCGCLSLEKCALYNPLDKAATKGPGPRYLLGDRSDEV